MKKTMLRSLLATSLALAFSGAIAGTAGGSQQNSTVVSAGAFQQTFLVTTDAKYNDNGAISIVGLKSLFGNLGLNLYSASNVSLTGALTSEISGINQKVGFLDKKADWNLAPSSSYILQVSGTALESNASYRLFGTQLQITPVPEPETYSMLLAGLGVIGAIALRRSRKS